LWPFVALHRLSAAGLKFRLEGWSPPLLNASADLFFPVAAGDDRPWLGPPTSVFKSVITDYLASVDFTSLRERTKADYQKHIATIEKAFADLPIAALADPKVTGEFLHWRDRIGGRQGDYAWSVLMLILAHGRTVGLTSYRPPGRIRKLYEADRSDKIWEAPHIEAFLAVAPEPLQWVLVFAAETGQRQADLLRLPWSSYDGIYLRLTPSKSK